MDITIKTLRLATIASAEIPIPGLSTALETALSIAKKIKEVDGAREDCKALAERAANLSLRVFERLKGCSAVAETKDHVKTLLQTLRDIENFMDKCLQVRKKRFGWLRFAFKHGGTAKRVEDLKTKLADAVNVFLVEAVIDTDQRMDTLVDTRAVVLRHVEDSARVGEDIMAHTRDIRENVTTLVQNSDSPFRGTFRCFARENLNLTEVIDDDFPLDDEDQPDDPGPTAQEGAVRVIRYRGTVKGAGDMSGKPVVIHVYPTREDLQYLEAVKFYKRNFNPFIVSALGYSRPGDPDEACFIVLEDYRPVEPHLSTIRGIDNLRMKLRMIVDICSSINHLERVKFHVELQHDDRGTHSLKSYAIRADEIMYDSSNGGRFKWVRDPSKPRDARYKSYGSMLSGPPLTGMNRKALVERLKPVAHEEANPHDVAATWFWLVQTYPWIVNMGRGMCDVRPYSPQGIAQVGEWLALDRGTPGWSNVVVDEEIRTAPVFTTGLSVLGSLAAAQTTPVNGPPKRTFGALTGYDKQNADCELTHDVRVGGLRWTRYLVRCMPVGTTFVFLQALDPDGTGDVSKAIRAVAAAASSDFRTMGIVTGRQYLFDTTLTHTADPAQEVPDSLWFFVLRRDRDQGVDHRCSTPWAFWSTEREPAEIPPDVTFDPTPRFEPLSKKPENPVFAWTQVLDGMTFSIQATVFHRFTMLTEDEILALRQLSTPDDSQRAYWDEMQGHAHIEEVPQCASDEPQNKRWIDMAARNSRTRPTPGAGTPFRMVHTRGQMAIQRLLGCLRDHHG